MRALGFGQVGCFGLLEGVLIAQIISLTVALKTCPNQFFDIISTPKLYYYNICSNKNRITKNILIILIEIFN